MKKPVYDVIILSGRQAGIPLAHALAEAKIKVALIKSRGGRKNSGCGF